MTMTLENAVTQLVNQTDELTYEVVDKITAIDQRVTDAETKLDNKWDEKNAEINSAWDAKRTEIDAKLNAFDNRVIYVAPHAEGTGEAADNPTTLAEALSKHIIPSATNTIKLSAGQHILPNQALRDIFLINFEPAGEFDPENPVIICTPHTIDDEISTDIVGVVSDSQICDAHAYDETALHFINSTIRFNNIQLRGTRHCLKFDKSTVFTSGDMQLDLWIYSASCTSHSGVALWAQDSNIYSEANLPINIWHPDYTGCTDVLADHAAPIFLDNTQYLQKGQLTWSSNIELTEYPRQTTIGWRNEFEAAHATAINLVNGAQLHIERLKINNIMQLFWADNASLSIAYMEMDQHSDPLYWLGQARGQKAHITMTNANADWPVEIAPNVVRIENTSNHPDLASLIAFDGADVFLDGVRFSSTACPCGSFMTTEAAEVFLQNSEIYALDRENNQGFMHISHNTNGKVIAQKNQLTTRLGDNDAAFVTLEGGFTKEKDNQLVCSAEYRVDSYGRHQDTLGNTQGLFSFAEDKTFKIPEDYPDLATAVKAISDLVVAPSAHITLDLAAGEHVLDQSLTIQNLQNITIQGAEPLEKTIVSFISATGSAGDWDVTLQLNDASDVEVGNYLLIHGVGGTGIPEVHLGGWEVIAISNNNVTVKHYCPESSFPANTLTMGQVKVLKTILVGNTITINSCTGLEIEHIALDQVTLGVLSSYLSLTKVAASQHRFYTANSFVTLNLLTVCKGASFGCYFEKSTVNSNDLLIANSNTSHGVHIFESASFNCHANNPQAILVSIYNQRGLFVRNSSITRLAGNSKDYYILHNVSDDIGAISNSFIEIESYTGSPTFSPPLNTEGNTRSFIAG
ncbi:hypothetical protein [Candidatus Albibeggiatoa sp. nov. NOAA]|uniref:hypothetical protein n=1 Tax=Candidatus Albibeggiatoa sp. nov. NOAA TaxID=3162724 RepID=UPI0033037770|nr:hypothetical protein [Thiotrichaceae bacterium]